MQNRRSMLRNNYALGLFLAIMSVPIFVTGTAQAHAGRHSATESGYFLFEGTVTEGYGVSAPGGTPSAPRYKDEPTLSQRIGTN